MPFETFEIGGREVSEEQIVDRIELQGLVLSNSVQPLFENMDERIQAVNSHIQPIANHAFRVIANRTGKVTEAIQPMVQGLYTTLAERTATEAARLATLPIPRNRDLLAELEMNRR